MGHAVFDTNEEQQPVGVVDLPAVLLKLMDDIANFWSFKGCFVILVLSSKWASVFYELTWGIGLCMDLGKFIKNTRNLLVWRVKDQTLGLMHLVFGAQWAP